MYIQMEMERESIVNSTSVSHIHLYHNYTIYNKNYLVVTYLHNSLVNAVTVLLIVRIESSDIVYNEMLRYM